MAVPKIDYYETWQGQKELEIFVNNRRLNRPRTTKFLVFFLFLIYVLLTIGGILAPILFRLDFLFTLLFILIFEMVLIETFLRFSLIELIKCYQHYASEITRRRCLCIPSCSDYSIACLKRYPLSFAFFKIGKRLFKTCKGEMYLIDKPYRTYETGIPEK